MRFADLVHPLAVAEQHRPVRLGLELLAQRRHLTGELVLAQRVRERHLEFGVVERLADEIRGAELHGLDHGRGSPLAGQNDDRHVAIDLLEGRQGVEPVHVAGHHDVEDDGGGAAFVVAPHSFFLRC
jgi:hypothetical protein